MTAPRSDDWNAALAAAEAGLDRVFERPYPPELVPADVIGRRLWRRERVREFLRGLVRRAADTERADEHPSAVD
jgi:hypothetical protein